MREKKKVNAPSSKKIMFRRKGERTAHIASDIHSKKLSEFCIKIVVSLNLFLFISLHQLKLHFLSYLKIYDHLFYRNSIVISWSQVEHSKKSGKNQMRSLTVI